MWFYLGLVTASVSFIAYLHQKLSIQSALLQRKTALIPSAYNKIPFRYSLDYSSNKKSGLFVLEIPCATSLQFSARKELSKDRWAKVLGVSYEFETGSEEFDKLTYIASITAEDAEIIGQDEAIITGIRDLIFEKPNSYVMTERSSIICDGKNLYLELHLYKDSTEQTINTFAARYLPKLRKLSTLLANKKSESPHFWKVPAQRNTAIFLAISLSLATWGGLEAARFFFLGENDLFSPLSIMLEAIFISALGLLLLTLLAFKCIKKSARRHLVIIDILIFGGLGLLFTIYGLLYDFNTMFDDSKPVIVNYEVISKYSERHRGRKGRTYYTYHVRLKDTSYPIAPIMKIDFNFYLSVADSDWITFTIRDGYLHKPWLENIQKCNSCSYINNENDY